MVDKESKMINTMLVYSIKCFKCGILEEEMVKAGPIKFCKKCFGEEFKDCVSPKGQIYSGSKVYKEWIGKYRMHMNALTHDR
jgi:hypothetical protein